MYDMNKECSILFIERTFEFRFYLYLSNANPLTPLPIIFKDKLQLRSSLLYL